MDKIGSFYRFYQGQYENFELCHNTKIGKKKLVNYINNIAAHGLEYNYL